MILKMNLANNAFISLFLAEDENNSKDMPEETMGKDGNADKAQTTQTQKNPQT